MKTKAQIEAQVDATFKALDAIEEVKVNPFFIHKVGQRMQKIEKKKPVISWFTPQLQLASFGLIFLLNVGAIVYSYASLETNRGSDIEVFAEEYSLLSETTITLN